MHPWSWIALGFLAGALVIGGYFAWTAPATRQPKPIATPKLAERRPVAPPLIPDSSNCTHVVRKGDTLQKIATEYGVTLAEVLQWNPQQKPDAALQVGLELRVCGGPQ
jgi:LysM repeat protein